MTSPGRWRRERVAQTIGPGTGRWWVRDDAGTLWVWCRWWGTRRNGGLRMWLPEPAPVPEWEERQHPHRKYTGAVHPSRITAALDLGFRRSEPGRPRGRRGPRRGQSRRPRR